MGNKPKSNHLRLVKNDETSELDKLASHAKSGDAEAFEELVRRTYRMTMMVALRIVRSEEEARDVVQDVYIRAQRSIHKFRGDSKVTTWLYRITANCASTHLTRRANRQHERLSDTYDTVETSLHANPVNRTEHTDLRSQLTAALGKLPDSTRTVVVLRDIYDLTHGAIAKELKISETAAKVRLHRGRKQLRELLKDSIEDDERAV